MLDDIVAFWEKIRGEDEVLIKFTKKDGLVRLMNCTLNFDKIPKADKPKKVDVPKILKLMRKAKIVHVYDLDKRGWRSVPFEKTEWLQTPNRTRYSIKK